MTLMAVDEEVRGKGIGNNFVRKADFWYHSHGLLTANVITQKENKGACSLFERNGYRIVDTEYIYHFYPWTIRNGYGIVDSEYSYHFYPWTIRNGLGIVDTKYLYIIFIFEL